MKKNRVIVGSIILMILCVWIFVVVHVNATAEKQQTQVYKVGDQVYYGDNYYDFSSEINNGYSLKVLSCNVCEYDEYLKLMGIADAVVGFHPKYVVDVEITFYNEDSSGGKYGVSLIPTYLAAADSRMAVSMELFGAIYPQLGSSPMGFKLQPNSNMTFHFPYLMELWPYMHVGDERHFLENTEFYLNATQYPVKQVIQMKNGSSAAENPEQ